jgi:hypothetical protein
VKDRKNHPTTLQALTGNTTSPFPAEMIPSKKKDRLDSDCASQIERHPVENMATENAKTQPGKERSSRMRARKAGAWGEAGNPGVVQHAGIPAAARL